jgi:hypothetical protein
MQEFDIVKFHLAMTSLGEVIPGLVESIVTSMGKMIKETPDNLPTAAEAKDFASRLKPAAETLGILAKAISAFMKLGTGPALKELQSATNKFDLQEAVGKLVQSMDIIFFGGAAKDWKIEDSSGNVKKRGTVAATGGIFSVIKTMLSKTKTLPKMDEAAAKALANTAGSAASVLGLIGKALKIMVGGTGGIPEDVRNDSAAKIGYLQDIAGFIQESLPEIATSMGSMIGTLMGSIEGAFSGKTVSRGMEKKIKNAVAAFKIFDPIVSLVSSFSRMFGAKTKVPDTKSGVGFAEKATNAIKDIMGALLGLDENGMPKDGEGIGEIINQVLDVVDGMDVKRFSKKKLKVLETTFDIFGSLVGTIKSIMKMTPKGGAGDGGMLDMGSGGMSAFSDVSPMIQKLKEIGPKISEGMACMTKGFENTPSAREISAVAAKLEAFTPVIDRLKSVNGDLVKFNEEAQNVAATVFAEGTPVNAVLDAVKTFGAAKGAKVKVQHSIKNARNARLNMQFTIKLDGKKVGAQIFEAGKIDAGNAGKGKWFVATSDFNGRNIAKKE